MNDELNKQCAEYEQRLKTQDEQMVQREMTIQELNIKLKVIMLKAKGQSNYMYYDLRICFLGNVFFFYVLRRHTYM